MTYADKQFQLSLMRAHFYIAEATTGVCKNRKIFHCLPEHKEVEFTDEEKVQNSLDIAMRHLQIAQDNMDEIGSL